MHVLYWPAEQGPRQIEIFYRPLEVLGVNVPVKGNPVEENKDYCSFPTFDIPEILLRNHRVRKGCFFELDKVEDTLGKEVEHLAVFIWIVQFGQVFNTTVFVAQ